jgi:hypothetical protein
LREALEKVFAELEIDCPVEAWSIAKQALAETEGE